MAEKKSVVRRVLRWIVISSLLMAVGATISLTLLYRAVTAPLPAYEKLLARFEEQRDSGQLEENRQQFESQIAALYSDAQTQERWQTVITADQINSWLATQLEIEYPDLEEQGLHDPRVIFESGRATIALRADMQGINAVVSLTMTPFVAEDGSLALQMDETHVGNVPLPTATIIQQADKALADEGQESGGLPGRWTQNEGNPVLLINFERIASTTEQIRSLDTLELREGEIYVAGSTEQRTARMAAYMRARAAAKAAGQ